MLVIKRVFGPVEDRIPSNPITLNKVGTILPDDECEFCQGSGKAFGPTCICVEPQDWDTDGCPHCGAWEMCFDEHPGECCECGAEGWVVA
jgi:hypothetical protein